MHDQLAPIALFLYNRPEHTVRVLESLKKNDLVEKSTLYIFCDGPKPTASPQDKENIEQVRNLAGQVDFSNQVIVERSELNKGLAKSILHGVNKVFSSYDTVIVIEDDLLLSRGFLKFMNACLLNYAANERIMHIGAYFPPVKGDLDPLILVQLTHSWGWATWKDRWQFLNLDPRELLTRIRERGLIGRFNYENSFNFYRMLRRTYKGTRDSWLILWYASVFLNDGLCLNPTRSLAVNSGHDNTGTHSHRTQSFKTKLYDEYDYEFPQLTSEDPNARNALKNFFWKQKIVDGPNYYFQLLSSMIKKLLSG